MRESAFWILLVGLLLITFSFAPLASAGDTRSESMVYAAGATPQGTGCFFGGTFLPCFTPHTGDATVEIEIQDASQLPVNGILEFKDANGDDISEHPFCGSIGPVDIPDGTVEVMVDRYIFPILPSGCLEAWWTAGTVTAHWN